jgi:hypothetical protein
MADDGWADETCRAGGEEGPEWSWETRVEVRDCGLQRVARGAIISTIVGVVERGRQASVAGPLRVLLEAAATERGEE